MEGLCKKNIDLLINKLNMLGLLEKILQDFELQTSDDNQKIEFAENLWKKLNLLPNYEELKQKKCNKKAEEFKDLGNKLYKERNFEEALVNYNKSLCFAPEDSENVGVAFANRSAVYFEMGQYEKSLENIELAKNHKYPKDKIMKLNTREEQAVEKLNNSPDQKQKKIKYEAAKESFMKPKLKAKENLNFFVADCLEVKTSPEFGRHVITNQDLTVGSVIVAEKPFSKIVEFKAIYKRCSNCLGNNLFNLIPCFNCCSAMFCSEECRNIAQEKFHKFECGLVNSIDVLFTNSFSLPLRTYFEALHICETPGKLREFLNSIKDSKATILDCTDEAELKNSLHAIDSLMTGIEHSNIYDLFVCSNICALVSDLMLNHSEALKAVLVDDADKVFFKELIFKYSQLARINFHGLSKFHVTTDEINEEEIGSGSFPFCSLLNHSCAPNTLRMPVGCSNYIIVNQPIKKGEQIFDNYCSNHCQDPLEERQTNLLKRYHFECNCIACKNNYPIYQDFKAKDPKLLATFHEDYEELKTMQNFELAVKNYDKYCKMIEKLAGDYPCYEIMLLQTMMLFCFSVFIKN